GNSQSTRGANRSVSAAGPPADLSVAKLCSQRLTGTRSTGAPRSAAMTRSRLVMSGSSLSADHSTVARQGGRSAMYEVLALKYGERDTTKCQFFYRESSHDKLTLDYFVWLILGGP